MGTFKTFEDIEAWRKAREVTREIYRVTGKTPFSRDFGLKDQIRRAVVSIMSNIAEGFERDGTKEFIQFLSTAKASAGEVRSQLYVALDQGYISEEQFKALDVQLIEVSKMIGGLMNYLKRTPIKGEKYRSPG